MKSRLIAAMALLFAVAGCARLQAIGEPPAMTAPGAPQQQIAAIAPTRVALAPPPPQPETEQVATASLWRSGPKSLFGDRRARTVGDILTVVVDIDEEAEIENSTTRNRSGSDTAALTELFGLQTQLQKILPQGAADPPGVNLNSTSASAGNGSTERAEDITLRLAATVVEVLPNGHLVISGSQEVRVNFELRDLQVAGVVRPEDISRRNEITYDKIADARIVYGGRGQITDLQQPRYGQQVLDVILPY